jgi:hypothetical protein
MKQFSISFCFVSESCSGKPRLITADVNEKAVAHTHVIIASAFSFFFPLPPGEFPASPSNGNVADCYQSQE